MSIRLAWLLLAGIGACPASGRADTLLPTTQSFTVTAQIVSGCGITSATGGASGSPNFGMLNFGSHPAVATGPVSAALAGNSDIQIQCSPGTHLTMRIDGGLKPGGGNAQRNLQGPDSTLIAYQLYSDAGHTQPIGIDEAVTVSVSGTVTLPIYGGLTLPGTGTPVGSYTDTVQVTLSY